VENRDRSPEAINGIMPKNIRQHWEEFEERELPMDYSVEKREDLVFPIVLRNEREFQDVMTRESIFSFPSAAAGTAIAGPPGTVAGHITGTVAGYLRHKRLGGTEEHE
jgi:hypothetical protein